MVRVFKISRLKVPELVKIAFEGDQDLIEKYHIVGLTLENSVQSTVDRINNYAKLKKCTFYKVVYRNQDIGFFVVAADNLYSFGIAIKYRIKNVLTDWWNEMRKVLKQKFYVVLYTRNERAVKFLLNRGMKIADRNINLTTLTSYKP